MQAEPPQAAMPLDNKTKNWLLELGMSVLSASGSANMSMRTAVPEALSNGLNTTIVALIQDRSCSNCTGSQIESYLEHLDLVLHSDVLCPKNRGRDKIFQAVIRDAAWTIASLAAALVALRIATKRIISKKTDWDDLAIGFAMIMTLAYAGSVATGAQKHQVCKRVWTVTWNQYKDNMRYLHDMELQYAFISWVTHAAVMAFYWNLVPLGNTPRNSPFRFFHKSIIVVAVATSAAHIVSILTISFQCLPIEYWKAPLDAKCLPRSQIWAVTSTAMVVSDILLLSLPIRVAWMLKLSVREKLLGTGMFLLGIFSCLVAIVRAFYTSRFLSDVDWTYSQCFAMPLTVLEPSLAIAAVCIPSLRVLAHKSLPKTTKLIQRLSISGSKFDEERPVIVELDRSSVYGIQETNTGVIVVPGPRDSNSGPNIK